jgi:hypothetical protein
MPFIFDDVKVPSESEPMLMQNGQTMASTPRVVSDENRQPHFEYDPPDYANREPGILEQYLPKEVQPYAGRIADIATGANDSLAGALGVPVAAVANVFRGFAGQPLMTSGDMKAVIQSELGRIPGMGTKSEEAFSEWYANLGETAGKQALITMALIAGAGPLAAGGASMEAAGAAAGPGGMTQTAGAVMKNIGETAVKYPGMVAAADVGAVTGGALAPQLDPLAKELGLNTSPELLELLGTFAGGPLGATIASAARIRPMVPGGGMEAPGLPTFGGKQFKETPTGPAILKTAKPFTEEGNFSPADIGKAVAGYKTKVESWIRGRAERIGSGSANPGQTAQREREAVRQGYHVARKRVLEPLWAKVDQSRKLDPVAMDGARKVANEVARSAVTGIGKTSHVPSDLVQAVLRLPKNPTLQQVREVASVISSEAVNLGVGSSKYTPNDTLRANMNALAKGLNDAIGKSFPGDKELAKAKEMTTWLHDTFSRGPVGAFGQVRKPGEFGPTEPQGAMESAMRDPRFGPQLAKMGETIGTPGAVQGRSEEYLRSMVAEAYRTGRPLSGTNPLAEEAIAAKNAQRYMNSPDFKAFAKAFPQMDAVLQRQYKQLGSAIAEADSIKSSAFFNKADTDPQSAVTALMNSGTKVRDAQVIRQKIGADPDALEAIKNALVEKIGMDTNWDPTLMAHQLSSKDTESLLRVFMDKQDVGRMKRLIGSVMEKQNATERVGSLSPALLGGRVLGSMFFRAAGVHTIQGTSVGAKIGGSIGERLFHVVPPDKLLARALVDPQWERFALSYEPDSLTNIKRTNKLLGLLVSTTVAGNNKLMEASEE